MAEVGKIRDFSEVIDFVDEGYFSKKMRVVALQRGLGVLLFWLTGVLRLGRGFCLGKV